MPLNKDEILRQIFSGEITQLRLPFDIYSHTSKKLLKGVYKGFKNTPRTVKYNSKDFKLIHSLRANVYHFSAAKTFQQTLKMNKALTKGGKIAKWEDFKEDAGIIFDDYNDAYLAAEYGTAIASGASAEAWDRFQENKDSEGMLRYIDTEGNNECEICASFHDTTAPVDDPIWDEIMPPNHYLCQCLMESFDGDITDSILVDKKLTVRQAIKKMLPEFKHNPGKTGQVFNSHHPYFEVPKEYLGFAKQNFGFTIPEEDEN